MVQHVSCCVETHNKSIPPSPKMLCLLTVLLRVMCFLLLNGSTAPTCMTGFISLDSCLEETAGNLKLQGLYAAISQVLPELTRLSLISTEMKPASGSWRAGHFLCRELGFQIMVRPYSLGPKWWQSGLLKQSVQIIVLIPGISMCLAGGYLFAFPWDSNQAYWAAWSPGSSISSSH